MAYLITNYKGVYRLRTPYDITTNQYPREPDGKLAESDIYIECEDNICVFYYGRGILEAYIPSIAKGRSIIRTIYRDYINKQNTETNISTFEKLFKGKLKTITRESITIINNDLFEKDLKSNENIIKNLQKEVLDVTVQNLQEKSLIFKDFLKESTKIIGTQNIPQEVKNYKIYQFK